MIYFLGSPLGFIKIGYVQRTTYKHRRIYAVQTGHPAPLKLLATMDGDYHDEQRLHMKFSDHRAHGEWFYICDELIDFIMEKTNLDLNSEQFLSILSGRGLNSPARPVVDNAEGHQ